MVVELISVIEVAHRVGRAAPRLMVRRGFDLGDGEDGEALVPVARVSLE